MLLHRARRVAIGAHAEWIRVLDLEQVRDLAEKPGDLGVRERHVGNATAAAGGQLHPPPVVPSVYVTSVKDAIAFLLIDCAPQKLEMSAGRLLLTGWNEE